MKRRACLLAAWLLALSSPAFAAADDGLVGTWTILRIETTRADGSRSDAYGREPLGVMMLDAGGHFSLVVVDPAVPKFAADDRLAGSPKENQAAVRGAVGYAGHWRSDGRVLTLDLDASTFPNWQGATQKRPFTLEGDDLRFTNEPGSPAGTILHVLRRVR